MMKEPNDELVSELEKFFGNSECQVRIADPAVAGGHSHCNWELLFFRRSKMVGFEKLEIIPPGVPHSSIATGIFNECLIVGLHHGRFGYTYRLKPVADFRGTSPLLELLVTDLEQIHKCHSANLGEELTRSHLRVFADTFITAVRTFTGKMLQPRPSDNFNYAAAYITNNYRRPSLALTEVAAHIGVNADSLSRLFRANIGITARNFLIRTRLASACELIRDGSYFLNDVAVKTGWNNYSYFAKTFRRHLGMTPGEFARDCNGGGIRTQNGIKKIFSRELADTPDNFSAVSTKPERNANHKHGQS